MLKACKSQESGIVCKNGYLKYLNTRNQEKANTLFGLLHGNMYFCEKEKTVVSIQIGILINKNRKPGNLCC